MKNSDAILCRLPPTFKADEEKGIYIFYDSERCFDCKRYEDYDLIGSNYTIYIYNISLKTF